MSFLKFWGKKSKAKDDLDIKKEETDPEAEKRKLRHSLSISRSGRFKQKNRERGKILDRPELYGTEQGEPEFGQHSACSETSSSASTTSTSSGVSSASSSTATNDARPPNTRHQGNPRRSGRATAT